MEKFEIIITTLFGLESLVKREVQRLGYETTSVEDGRVTFFGDWEAVCRANMWIRTGERVLIKIAEFNAVTFDELFEGTKAVDWQLIIGRNDAFPVKGYSLKSTLASVRDCQAIIKKAAADKLSQAYGISWLPEDGVTYQINFSVFKDKVTLMIDTSGEGLHKRGYRQISNVAPLKETLAAAMVEISHWRFEYPLCDPFCGSGTIPIEAAMIKRNIAPGISRTFACSSFPQISSELQDKVLEEAKSLERDVPLEIYAYDIDTDTVELAKSNAVKAGVGKFVIPKQGDARKLDLSMPYGSVICNPPYGERIGEIKECEQLYREIGKSFKNLDKWSYYIITSNENFEMLFGKHADKKRKLYNGMIKCNLYQFFGERPPKKAIN
ncbi:MAG: class I SAM-dependent RNA methyltransferase [Oscillospiraceae bacterium]|nr:class I SAM-dependent RNA methyltransferase [Oscillospiraceae bacterium]